MATQASKVSPVTLYKGTFGVINEGFCDIDATDFINLMTFLKANRQYETSKINAPHYACDFIKLVYGAKACDKGAAWEQYIVRHPDSPKDLKLRIRFENEAMVGYPAPTSVTYAKYLECMNTSEYTKKSIKPVSKDTSRYSTSLSFQKYRPNKSQTVIFQIIEILDEIFNEEINLRINACSKITLAYSEAPSSFKPETIEKTLIAELRKYFSEDYTPTEFPKKFMIGAIPPKCDPSLLEPYITVYTSTIHSKIQAFAKGQGNQQVKMDNPIARFDVKFDSKTGLPRIAEFLSDREFLKSVSDPEYKPKKLTIPIDRDDGEILNCDNAWEVLKSGNTVLVGLIMLNDVSFSNLGVSLGITPVQLVIGHNARSERSTNPLRNMVSSEFIKNLKIETSGEASAASATSATSATSAVSASEPSTSAEVVSTSGITPLTDAQSVLND